jgi:hypothetical protein
VANEAAVRNDCPANITYDLLEYDLQGIRPGDVVILPVADAARLLVADTVWSPADDAAHDVVRQLEELHLATAKAGEPVDEERHGVEVPLGETGEVTGDEPAGDEPAGEVETAPKPKRTRTKEASA